MIRDLVLILTFVGTVFSACPSFQTSANLNLTGFSGNWQIQGMIRTLGNDPGMQCLQAEFISENWSTTPVNVNTTIHGEYVATDVHFHQDIPTTIPSLNQPGLWDMNINGTESQYAILDTDYSEYSLSVTCATVNGVDDLVAFFKTRSHSPMPENVVESYKVLLQSVYGIDTNLYFEIVNDEMLCEDHVHP